MDDDRYWPFDVLPPEKRSALHQEQITLLEAAYREGFRPYMYGPESFGASSNDRHAQIIRRTRQFSELVVNSPSEGTLSAYVAGFTNNANAVLQFLRGVPIPDILNVIRPHLISVGGRASGFRHAAAKCPRLVA